MTEQEEELQANIDTLKSVRDDPESKPAERIQAVRELNALLKLKEYRETTVKLGDTDEAELAKRIRIGAERINGALATKNAEEFTLSPKGEGAKGSSLQLPLEKNGTVTSSPVEGEKLDLREKSSLEPVSPQQPTKSECLAESTQPSSSTLQPIGEDILFSLDEQTPDIGNSWLTGN